MPRLARQVARNAIKANRRRVKRQWAQDDQNAKYGTLLASEALALHKCECAWCQWRVHRTRHGHEDPGPDQCAKIAAAADRLLQAAKLGSKRALAALGAQGVDVEALAAKLMQNGLPGETPAQIEGDPDGTNPLRQTLARIVAEDLLALDLERRPRDGRVMVAQQVNPLRGLMRLAGIRRMDETE